MSSKLIYVGNDPVEVRGPYNFDKISHILNSHITKVGWLDGRMLVARDFMGHLVVLSHECLNAAFWLGDKHLLVESWNVQLILPIEYT